jgi:hypothetical protein
MEFIKPYTVEILCGLAVVVVLQLFFVMALSSRLNRLSRMVRSLLTGPEGADLEEMLKQSMQASDRALTRGDELDQRLVALVTEMRSCVQRVGLVRFDAYGDVSGEQSFSLALLDGYNNGAIVTGLFGRMDSRCYGKVVVDSRTEQALSEEEEQALQMALNGGTANWASFSAAPSATTNKFRLRREREATRQSTS